MGDSHFNWELLGLLAANRKVEVERSRTSSEGFLVAMKGVSV